MTEDLRGAFYASKLPPAWRQRVAFEMPFPGHVVGMPEVRSFRRSDSYSHGLAQCSSPFQPLRRRVGSLHPEDE